VQTVDGPDALHELEHRALADALESQPPAVIAAAASVVDDAEARELLRRAGVVIWLTADVDELARRVQTAGHRPLALDPTPQLRQQFATRAASFADVADVVVDAKRDPKDIVDELIVELANR
jgi:shikimate kinase